MQISRTQSLAHDFATQIAINNSKFSMTSLCLPTPVLSHSPRHPLRDNSVVQPAVITDPPHLRSLNAGTPAVTINQRPSLRALNAKAMSRKGNFISIWLRCA